MIKEDDAELAAAIEAGYISMGCAPEEAKALVLKGYEMHYQIEDSRRLLIEASGVPEESRINFILLVIQLEMTHLQLVMRNVMEQVGNPLDGETMQ